MTDNDNTQFELGTWLGRRQAFSLIASRCSAADAECLRKIRDEKKYKSLDMSWDEFCAKHAGMTRRYADEMIRQLEELGPGFFRLSEVVRIAPQTFRLISGAVKEEGLEFQGETIAIAPENSEKIHAAVEALRVKAIPPEPPRPVQAPKPRPIAVNDQSISQIGRKLDGVLEELRRMTEGELTMAAKLKLFAVTRSGIRHLERVSGRVNPAG